MFKLDKVDRNPDIDLDIDLDIVFFRYQLNGLLKKIYLTRNALICQFLFTLTTKCRGTLTLSIYN